MVTTNAVRIVVRALSGRAPVGQALTVCAVVIPYIELREPEYVARGEKYSTCRADE